MYVWISGVYGMYVRNVCMIIMYGMKYGMVCTYDIYCIYGLMYGIYEWYVCMHVCMLCMVYAVCMMIYI